MNTLRAKNITICMYFIMNTLYIIEGMVLHSPHPLHLVKGEGCNVHRPYLESLEKNVLIQGRIQDFKKGRRGTGTKRQLRAKCRERQTASKASSSGGPGRQPPENFVLNMR